MLLFCGDYLPCPDFLHLDRRIFLLGVYRYILMAQQSAEYLIHLLSNKLDILFFLLIYIIVGLVEITQNNMIFLCESGKANSKFHHRWSKVKNIKTKAPSLWKPLSVVFVLFRSYLKTNDGKQNGITKEVRILADK